MKVELSQKEIRTISTCLKIQIKMVDFMRGFRKPTPTEQATVNLWHKFDELTKHKGE